jgi:predicted ATPase
MTDTISYLKIANYRSIDTLELHDIKPFSVFAGSNGSGKSNFFDALDFVNWVIRFGADEALKKYGGFENIRCWRRRDIETQTFEFAIDFSKNGAVFNHYQLKIYQLDNTPLLEEKIQWVDDEGKMRLLYREAGKSIQAGKNTLDLPVNFSILLLLSGTTPIGQFLKNIRLYRIDPHLARMPVKNTDTSKLDYNGRNLAGVLHRLEKDEYIYEAILEWMNLFVPCLEKVYTDFDNYDGSIRLVFKEDGFEKPFPAHLVSDGTIFMLGILVALFDRSSPFSLTLIEMPENGLHPKANIELIEDFHQETTFFRPIWVTTHHDSLIRGLKNHELWLVDKKQGQTKMKQVQVVDKLTLPLDQAWLCNMLGGGLP